MKWTRKLPTQAGWWWSMFIPYGRKKETAVVILHITRNGSKKLRVGAQSLESLCQYGERLWAGPLEPPHPREVED
ncbi:MAG: hypothetical protein K6E40_01905 [Desulfovibrio sp.]|nr:hypothetical protein [Desulfovibrio sp.]